MNIFKRFFNFITGFFRKKKCYICHGPVAVEQDRGRYLCYDHIRDYEDQDYPEYLEEYHIHERRHHERS